MTAENDQNGRRMSAVARNPAASDATTKPIVPAPPKSPCAVDDRPGGLPAATTAYRAGLSAAKPVASMRISGTAQIGLGMTV